MAQPMIQLDPADFAEPTDVIEEAVATQDATTEAPSAEGTNSPEVVADQPHGTDKPSAEQPAEDQAAPAEEPAEETTGDAKPLTAPTTSEEPTGEPLSGAEKRKADLTAEIEQGKQQLGIDPNAEIRDLVAARNAIRQVVEARNSQVYATPSVEDIMAETGQDEANARITALERRTELKDWNDRAIDAQLTLGTQSQRVLQDFAIFNPESPDFQPTLAQQAAQVLEANLVRDTNVPEVDPTGRPTGKGMIIGFRATPYQIYKPIADAHALALARAEQTRVEGQIEGQRSAEKMLAAAEPASSAVPQQPKEDPFLAGLTKGLRA